MEKKYIQDKDGAQVLPITHISAVRDDAGNTLDSILANNEQALLNESNRAKAAENDRYTKSETYNKTELNNLITTPNQQYVTVAATDQTTAATDVLPATGSADTIYRVGNWDGSQYSEADYTEYAWNGSTYINLSTKSQAGEVYDISVNHADTKYADLSAALGTNGANIPQSLRKGGMSVKFVQSSDNKYVQYRLMKNSWSVVVTDWQGVDDVPTAGSNNLVKSGGVENKISVINNTLEIESSGGSPAVDSSLIGKYIGIYGDLNSNVAYRISQAITLPQGATIKFKVKAAAGVVSVLAKINGSGYSSLVNADETILKEYTYNNTSSEAISVVISWIDSAGASYSIYKSGKIAQIQNEIDDLENNQSEISETVETNEVNVQNINNSLGTSITSGVPNVDSSLAGKYINSSGYLETNAGYSISQSIALPKGATIKFKVLGVSGVVCVLAFLPQGATRYTTLVVSNATELKEYTYINNRGYDIDVVICWANSKGASYTITNPGKVADIGDLSQLTTQHKETLVAAINEINNLSGGTRTNYSGHEIGIFHKCLCIGDSLTAGTFNYYEDGSTNHAIAIPKYSYPQKLAEMLGIKVTNLGVGGRTSAEWYAEKQNDDLSGYDFAIIQLGVNDYYEYGGWTQTSIDAFTNIINKLKNENKNIKIFVSTIIPATAYNLPTISQGIRDLVANIDDTNVILLDMAVYSHVGDSEAYNCGHLSAFGYWRLAKDYYNYISWYISENKNLFREVQFIGTDYEYTPTIL